MTKKLAILLWVIFTFLLSIVAFRILIDNYTIIVEPWHRRVVDSNLEYALALVFTLLITFGHALVIGGTNMQAGITRWLYRVVAMPILIIAALLSFWPLAFDSSRTLESWPLLTLLLWYLISSDPNGFIGSRFSKTSWFQRILAGAPGGGIMRGMHGYPGFITFNLALLIMLAAGVVIS